MKVHTSVGRAKLQWHCSWGAVYLPMASSSRRSDRTVTDSRHYMHLLTPEQRALEQANTQKDMRRSRGEMMVEKCLELPPPPLENTLSKLGARSWQLDAPFKTLDSYFELRAGNAWNHEKKQAAMQQELQSDADEVNGFDATGRTRLMWAAMRGQYDCALRLLDAGARLDIQDIDGWTAVTWATSYGRAELLQLLIDRGADLEIPAETETKWTPFHYGCFMGKAECVRALIRAGCKTDTKVKASIGKKRWTTGVELAQLQQTEEHAATVLVVNTVKSNEMQAAEDAARVSAALEHEIRVKTQQFGKGVAVADANIARAAAASTLSRVRVKMDKPLSADALKLSLVNKRRSDKMLADCGISTDVNSTPRGNAVSPDGPGWSRGVYLGIGGDAAATILTARKDVVEAVEAAAAWMIDLPDVLYVQLLAFHDWLPEHVQTTARGAKRSPRGSAARANDNEAFVRLCRSAVASATPFELVAHQVVLCADHTIQLMFTVAEDSTLEGGAQPCPLNTIASDVVTALLKEGPMPAHESSFFYDEATLLKPPPDNLKGNASTIASCVIGACAPGTQPCELSGVIDACKVASEQLAGLRVSVNELQLLQHTRYSHGGRLPDPRCCVWRSTQPLR